MPNLSAWGPGSRGVAHKRRVARKAGRPRQFQRASWGGFSGPSEERRLNAVASSNVTTEYSANGSFARPHKHAEHSCIESNYGQASRLISIGKLNASPRLHTRPITWSSSRSLQEPYGSGDLILWRVSRLDAFSVSPFRT